MIGVVLALGASGLWGSADFLGGQAARRLPLLVVTFVSQAAGLLALAVVLGVRGGLHADAAVWGFAAGVVGVGSVSCFYRALSVGTMSVVAPIVSTSAAVPVLVGFARGEKPSTLASAGILAALIGVVLASRSPSNGRPREHRRSLVLAAAAALLLGLQLVFLSGAGHHDAMSGVAASRATSVAVFGAAALLQRPSIQLATLPGVALIGLLDTGANLAYALATARGLLSLITVLASLYPIVTVGLAYGRLGERISRSQTAGVAIALAGVVVILAR